MKDDRAFVQTRIHEYYWQDDVNCATATLKILSEKFHIPLHRHVLDAALGMHGAGEYGAQCGLVEGGLMFLGIFGRDQGIPDEDIVAACKDFALQFEKRFGSLLCAVLRPQGFRPENPPHLCENLSWEALAFDIRFVSNLAQGPHINREPKA
jgi:C_GCAxxG_C_C family probable redox protein